MSGIEPHKTYYRRRLQKAARKRDARYFKVKAFERFCRENNLPTETPEAYAHITKHYDAACARARYRYAS